jgi:hypothetical protein
VRIGNASPPTERQPIHSIAQKPRRKRRDFPFRRGRRVPGPLAEGEDLDSAVTHSRASAGGERVEERAAVVSEVPAAGVLAPVRATFRAVAVTVVPEAASLDEADWRRLEAIVEGALAARPARLQRQLRLLLRIIRVLPLARWGRTFDALDAERRTRILERLQDAPVFTLRRGFWGLRTLVLMGYYARPEAAAAIGYAANVRGWEAR